MTQIRRIKTDFCMKNNLISEYIFTISDFFTSEDCESMILRSENYGYEAATVETEKGKKIIADVRNNQRILWSDEILAGKLWNRVKEFVPEKIGNSKAIGLNELFRFYKYEPGQKFKKHIDESFIRNDEEASYYTFMIYLNDGYEGGETTFDNLVVKGEKGMAIIFLHSLPHEGAEVIKGVKYVLRTDIMYRLEG
jgi:prolyl 4-hydroxylase